jgi:hypothetical protein
VRGKKNAISKSFAEEIIKSAFLCCQNGNIFDCSRENALKRDNFKQKNPICINKKRELHELYVVGNGDCVCEIERHYLFEIL